MCYRNLLIIPALLVLPTQGVKWSKIWYLDNIVWKWNIYSLTTASDNQTTFNVFMQNHIFDNFSFKLLDMKIPEPMVLCTLMNIYLVWTCKFRLIQILSRAVVQYFPSAQFNKMSIWSFPIRAIREQQSSLQAAPFIFFSIGADKWSEPDTPHWSNMGVRSQTFHSGLTRRVKSSYFIDWICEDVRCVASAFMENPPSCSFTQDQIYVFLKWTLKMINAPPWSPTVRCAWALSHNTRVTAALSPAVTGRGVLSSDTKKLFHHNLKWWFPRHYNLSVLIYS